MDKNARSPRHRLLKILLASMVGLIVAVAVVLGVALIYVRTPAGSDRVLSFARGFLRDHMATRLEYREGRLDPLTGLHFRDLRVVRNTPELQLDLAIAAVDVSYALGFSRIVVNEFRFDRPQIKVVTAGAKRARPEEKKTAGGGFAKLLEGPLVGIEVQNAAVDDLKLEFEQKTADESSRFELSGLNLRAALALVKERLVLTGEIKPGADFAFSVDQKQRVRAQGGFSGKWSGGIRREGREWIYEIEPSVFEASLAQVSLTDQETSVHLKSLKMDASLRLLAKTLELFQGSADAVKNDEVTAHVAFGPLEIRSPGNRLAVAEQKLSMTSRLAGDVHVDLDYRLNRITLPEKLARPLAVGLSAAVVVPRDLASAKLQSDLALDGDKVMTLEGSASKTEDGAIRGKAKLRALLKTRLLSLLKLKTDQQSSAERLLPLAAEGDIDAQRDAQGTLAAEAALRFPDLRLPGFAKPWSASLGARIGRALQGDLDADVKVEGENLAFGKWRVSTRTKVRPDPLASEGHSEVAQLARGEASPLALPAPVSIDHKVDLKDQANSVVVAIDAPEIGVLKKASIKATHLEVSARSSDFKAAQNADIEFSVRQGSVELDPSLGETPIPIKGATASVRASLRDGKRLALDQFQLNLNGSTVALSADGALNILTKDGQLRAEAGVSFGDGLELAGQKLKGRVAIPVALTVFQGREANITGGVQLHGLSWAKNKIAISGIEGRLPFSEKILWDGKAARFQHLITENPFERVDFERVRPLLQGTEQVRIEKISWEEREYGPFVGFVAMNQNMLNVHQFDLDLGAGRMYGEMFFDAYPANLRLGVLARMTGLDLGEVLPKRFLARMQGGSKVISGRSGFILNLNRGALDGRLDLTELGGQQLVALINTIDPSYEDEKMNKVRGLLQLGYPTALALAFKDGYMNMDIDLSILGVRQRQSLREIPLSSLLGSVTSEIVKKTEKGPLKQ